MKAHRHFSASGQRALRWKLFLAACAIVMERTVRAFWPAWSLALAFYALLAFSNSLPGAVRIGMLAVFAAAVSAALAAAIVRFRWPDRIEVRNRLDSGLPGRPLASIEDIQALGSSDPDSAAVWRAHIRRKAQAAAGARPPSPDLRLSHADTFAVRYGALTAFALALLFAPVPSLRFDQSSVSVDALAAAGPGFEAWVMPPAYTGAPGVYLNTLPDAEPVKIPAASLATVRFDSSQGHCSLVRDFGDGSVRQDFSQPQTAEFGIHAGGSLAIGGPGCDARRWEFEAIEDLPPTVALSGQVETGPTGELRLPLEFRDDYGIEEITAWAELELDQVPRRHGLAADPESRVSPAVPVGLPFSGPLTEFETTVSRNFSSHAWAGLPANLVVRAEDGVGGFGMAEVAIEALPGLALTDQNAMSFAELQRDLKWSPHNAPRVSGIGRALTHRPYESKLDTFAYLLSRTALHGMETGGASRIPEAADLLWQAALQAEGNVILNARQQMMKAAERLREAIQSGAEAEDIARLMEAYRQAAEEFLRQMRRQAEAAAENGLELPEEFPPGQNMQMITESEILRMLEELGRLLEQGRTADAEQLLQEIRRTLENSVASRSAQGRPGGAVQQSMSGIAETFQRQQGLADEAYRQLEEMRRQGEAGQSQENIGGSGGLGSGQDHFGQGTGQGESAGALAERQENLRRSLRGQMMEIGRLGSGARQALDDFESAARAMTDARDRLGDGELSEALQDQHRAMRDLAAGMQSLRQQMADADGSGYGGPPGSGFTSTDPFGRHYSGSAGFGYGEQMVPDELAAERSRKLRDEIRRRAGEAARPEAERSYLMRLLGEF